MFSINGPGRGISRRQLLRFGGLGTVGLTLPNLLQAADRATLGLPGVDKTFGRAKNVIFLYLAGGPPQHETFDPKPDAPVEVRGPFQPISTVIPGIHFCELLPRTARIADKLAVVRSMATDDNTHSSSSYWVLTGYKYAGPNARTIQPTDWPYFGSLVKRYKPSDVLPPLSTVWIPDVMRLNENVTPAGQTSGLMGSQWDPERFVGDPSAPGYRMEGLRLANVTTAQLARRQRLLQQIEQPFDASRRGAGVKLFETYQQQAFELLTSGKASQAFAIQQEPDQVRRRYGMNRWGQCVLLARRLVEAGVRLVHVQWPREPGDNAVDNPLWDTHAQNADRVEDVLCPQFDLGFSALIEDLEQRGLLDETLVVAIGEFGRTPKINAKGGRDHWGSVFSFAMAGAGISGGQVYGASDKHGGHPFVDRVQPGDLTATMFHLLGLPHQSVFRDPQGRQHRLTEGAPIAKLLGITPATDQRTASSGEIARVPPFDPTITLLQADFAGPQPLKPITAPSRPKGWRAAPLLPVADIHSGDSIDPKPAETKPAVFGVTVVNQQAALGLHGVSASSDVAVEQGALAVLAQEVRSPFAGTYTLRVAMAGSAATAADYAKWFNQHFTCKLQFFEFTDKSKNASKRKELAAVAIKPPFVDDIANLKNANLKNANLKNANLKNDDSKRAQSKNAAGAQQFTLTKQFTNPKPGSNFSFGLGLGIAVLVEKTSKQPIQWPVGPTPLARVHIARVELEFAGKERNEKVKV